MKVIGAIAFVDKSQLDFLITFGNWYKIHRATLNSWRLDLAINSFCYFYFPQLSRQKNVLSTNRLNFIRLFYCPQRTKHEKCWRGKLSHWAWRWMRSEWVIMQWKVLPCYRTTWQLWLSRRYSLREFASLKHLQRKKSIQDLDPHRHEKISQSLWQLMNALWRGKCTQCIWKACLLNVHESECDEMMLNET